MKSCFAKAAAVAAMVATPVMAHVAPQDTNGSSDSTTVVVKGKTPDVVHKIDRSVYDLRNSPQAATGSVSDVLATLPSVNVDQNGGVSVRGASTQVLIDGKPSAALKGANLATALQSMPANTVAKIEVITNPGAEFHTDAATVINIITRQSLGGSSSGTLIANIGTAGRHNATLSGQVSRDKWTFTGSLSSRQDQRSNYVDVDRITSAPSHFVQASRVKVHIYATQLDGGVTYAASDRDSFSLNGDVSIRIRPRVDSSRFVFLDPSNIVTSDSTTSDRGRQYFNSASLDGQWKHKGQRDGETFTLLAHHEEDENLRDYRYDDVSALPAAPDVLYRRAHGSRELTDNLSGDYVLPLGQDQQFKAGFEEQSDQSEDRNTATDTVGGTEIVNAALSNRFLVGQTLDAAYVDYQQPFGKWIAEAGLRLETMRTKLQQTREDAPIRTWDVQWSPSLYLNRSLGDNGKLRFSYSHRIDRPDAESLNPLDYVLDAQDIQVGNPYLRPGQTESFEAGYDYTTRAVTFNGTLYARQTRDTITEYTYYRHPGDTVLIISLINAGRGSQDGLDLSLNLHPAGKLSYSLNSDIYGLSQTAPVSATASQRQSILTHNSKATIDWAVTDRDTVEIQALLNGKSLSAQGTNSGTNLLNLTWSRKINPRLKLVGTATDILNSVRIRQIVQTDQYRDNTLIRIPGRIVYIGLTYKLGAVAS